MICFICGVELDNEPHHKDCISIMPSKAMNKGSDSFYHVQQRLQTEGVKFDSDKPYQPELIAPEFIFETSQVLAYGARKYAPRNWEKGMAWSRPFGAMMRHMWAWWSGEDKDPETGFSHLAHAACCLMFLMAYESRGTGTDDRYHILQNSNGRTSPERGPS